MASKLTTRKNNRQILRNLKKLTHQLRLKRKQTHTHTNTHAINQNGRKTKPRQISHQKPIRHKAAAAGHNYDVRDIKTTQLRLYRINR